MPRNIAHTAAVKKVRNTQSQNDRPKVSTPIATV
jgi:hypothetical protein